MFLKRKELVEGRQLPRGYRFAYWDVCRQRGIAYPIGLHLIPKLIRRIWEWSLAYRPSTLERLLTETRKAAIAECKSQIEHPQGPIDFNASNEEWTLIIGEMLKRIGESKEMKWNQS